MMNTPRALLLASVLCVASCARPGMPLPPYPDWVDFYSAPMRHAAEFPDRPKASVKEAAAPGGQKVFTYLHELPWGDRYFGTGWVQIPAIPADQAGREQLLDIAMNAAVKSTVGGTLVATSTFKPVIRGIEGRMYTIDIPGNKTRLRQQIFIAGDGIVEQTFSGPAGTETDADAERFFTSLELLP